jgi:GT2 family glycosyltransferase
MAVDLIPGSYMFMDFKKFKKIGYFYPNTFLFVEERFITKKVQQQGWQNYLILNQSYVHAHSKTIDTVHNKVSKYKMLYKGWLEYTKVYRRPKLLKLTTLKVLMVWSILELKLVHKLKTIVS